MMWENNRVFVSVTKLKNPVKFVLEGIFVVLVESTGFEKKKPTQHFCQSGVFPLRSR